MPDDLEQLAAVLLPQQRSGDAPAFTRVVGRPGSGKSELAVLLVRRWLELGGAVDEVMVLAPTRDTASRLLARLRAAVRVATPGPLVRSIPSLAYDVVRQHAMAETGRPPLVLGGAAEDAWWREILRDERLSPDSVAWPPPITPEVLGTAQFRAELRELLARAVEQGLSPETLAGHAPEGAEALWAAVAELWGRSERARALQAHAEGQRILTNAELLRAAAMATATGAGRPFRLVIVDDAQELTPGALRFVQALNAAAQAATGDARVLLLGNPDVAALTFRGAEPGLLAEVTGSATHVLPGDGRLQPGAAAAYDAVVADIGGAPDPELRRPDASRPQPPLPEQPAYVAYACESPAAQAALVAGMLRARHVLEGVPWRDLAVIARAARQLEGLATQLQAAGIPVSLAGVRPLRHSPVAAPLVEIVELGASSHPLQAATIERLLGSPLVGLDALRLRHLRRTVRVLPVESRLHLGQVVQHLADADPYPEWAKDLPGEVLRLARAIRAGRASAEAAPEEALWAVWEALGVAEEWRVLAEGDGDLAPQANLWLDDVVALFRQAAFYGERFPERTAREFSATWRSADLDDDSLAPQGATDGVVLATPSQVISRAFDSVAVVGVERGAWPNTRERSSVLHGDALVRGSDRAEVLADERRMFALAISRARHRTVVTAVRHDEQEPSEFIAAHVLPAPAVPLRGIREEIGHCRRILAEEAARQHSAGDAWSEAALQAAATLRFLADQGVRAAQPEHWAGLKPPSTEAPLRDPAEPVHISPSAVGRFQQCPVQWAAGSVAGASTGMKRQVGDLVHAAVSTTPDLDEPALLEFVQQHWSEIPFAAEWHRDAELEQQLFLTRRLASYFRELRDNNRQAPPELRELRVQATVPATEGPDARISGSIDWVECATDSTEARLVDLKTGAPPQSEEKRFLAPQLQTYQLALQLEPPAALDGRDVNELRLLYPQKSGSFAVAVDALAEEPEEFRNALLRVAKEMAAAYFTADPEEHCLGSERFTPDCRLHVTEQVSE